MESKPKRGKRLELEIETLDSKGQGVARMGEYTVRVRGALPGDRLIARIGRVRHRRRQAEARREAVLQTEVDRIPARCCHFGTCGGCVWQDVSYETQVRLKQDLVDRCLKEAGIDVALGTPLLAEHPFFYRNKMEFSFGISREGRVDLGLHIPGRFDRIFDLEACHLQSERSNRIVDWIRRFVRQRNLSAYHLHRHEGLMRFLTVREGKQTGETMVILTTSGEDLPGAGALGEALMQAFPEIKSVVHSINRRKAQVAVGDEEIVIAGRPAVQEKLGNFVFEISPSSFFQPNTLQSEQLYRRVVELIDPRPEDRALDVYCGTGGISLFLSERVGQVVGIEVAESAVQDAVRNSANNGVDNCRFISGAAEQILHQLKVQGEHFDVAVTDPPRPGMHLKALQALAELRPNRIVYVSCNPQVLGADLKRLQAAGYRTDYLQLVDMLPHTPHCEVLARLVYTG